MLAEGGDERLPADQWSFSGYKIRATKKLVNIFIQALEYFIDLIWSYFQVLVEKSTLLVFLIKKFMEKSSKATD